MGGVEAFVAYEFGRPTRPYSYGLGSMVRSTLRPDLRREMGRGCWSSSSSDTLLDLNSPRRLSALLFDGRARKERGISNEIGLTM